MTTELLFHEAEELERHEAVIERGLHTVIEVASSLAAIRESRLYRATHGTFEDYCRERWAMTRQHANRMISAARIAETLEPIGSIPESESQVRPLARLEPEQQLEVWSEAVATAPNGKPTARHVEEVAERIAPKLSPPSPSPELREPLPGQGDLFVVEPPEDDQPNPDFDPLAPPKWSAAGVVMKLKELHRNIRQSAERRGGMGSMATEWSPRERKEVAVVCDMIIKQATIYRTQLQEAGKCRDKA